MNQPKNYSIISEFQLRQSESCAKRIRIFLKNVCPERTYLELLLYHIKQILGTMVVRYNGYWSR